MLTGGRTDRQGRRSYNISSPTNLRLFVSCECSSKHVKSGNYRPVRETPSGWRFADGPIMARGFADGPIVARDEMLAGLLTWLKARIKEKKERKTYACHLKSGNQSLLLVYFYF